MRHSTFMLSLIGLLLVTGTTLATPIPNPQPGVLADDLDDSGYFTPGSPLFVFEVSDVGESVVGVGSTFGFYFEGSDVNDPTNLITIFEPTDTTGDQSSVNFASGIVVDIEDAIVQNTFSGSGDIGFFLTLNAFGGLTLFSDPLLNDNDLDWMGAFPFIVDPTRVAVWFIDPATGGLLGVDVVAPLTPAENISEPSALLLMLSLTLLLPIARRRWSA